MMTGNLFTVLINAALTACLLCAVPANAQDAQRQRLQAAYDAARADVDSARADLVEIQTRARTTCSAVETARAEQERAEENNVCVNTLRPELEALRAAGVSRADQRQQMITRLAECRGNFQEPVLAAQRTCIADTEAANASLANLIAAQEAFLDAGNTLASSIAANTAAIQAERARLQAERARLQAEIEASRARQRAMLAEAERILQNLATP